MVAMAMAGKQKDEFWRELHEDVYAEERLLLLLFGWATYAPWAN
jgi:hypothetical protein